MSSHALRRHAMALRALDVATSSVRKTMVSNASAQLVLALVRAARDIIKGRIKLTPAQFRRLRPYEATLQGFITSKTLRGRKQALQKGGFLGALIKPLLHLVGGALFGGPGRR